MMVSKEDHPLLWPTFLRWVLNNVKFNYPDRWFLMFLVRVSFLAQNPIAIHSKTSNEIGDWEKWRYTAGGWFGTFFVFPYSGDNHPNWLIFFRGVETTNQTDRQNPCYPENREMFLMADPAGLSAPGKDRVAVVGQTRHCKHARHMHVPWVNVLLSMEDQSLIELFFFHIPFFSMVYSLILGMIYLMIYSRFTSSFGLEKTQILPGSRMLSPQTSSKVHWMIWTEWSETWRWYSMTESRNKKTICNPWLIEFWVVESSL